MATQNILREEAHLTDVIDPLGGSYYVEALTNEMEERVLAIMADVEAAGGMYRAVESGMVQRRIGESARAHQERVDSGAQTVVGVNAYQVDEDASARPALAKPDPAQMRAHVRGLRAVEGAPVGRRGRAGARRSRAQRAGDGTAAAPTSSAQVVAAADVGCTHGEICGTLRRELGFGNPLVVV